MSNTPNQKRRRAERTKAFVEDLKHRYPKCFTSDRAAVHPLAIGIQELLREDLNRDPDYEDTPNWLIKQALARYTHAPSYLEAIMAGRSRIDLHGQPSGDVTDEAKQHARQRRDEQKKRAAERRRASKPQRGRRPSGATDPKQQKLERLAKKYNDHR